MRKIVDICPFCGKETLSYEPGFITSTESTDVKFSYVFMCENCCEEWTVWETYTLAEKKRWYSKYVEVEEDMLNEDKKCTCDECCGGDNCKSKDEKPACETKDANTDANTDAIQLNLEVEVDEDKLKKAVDAIVDEAFKKAGKVAETSKGSWDDFFGAWEDLWAGLSKEEEPFKITCGTVAGPNVKFGTINEVLDDLWRKPAKKVNYPSGHPQEK